MSQEITQTLQTFQENGGTDVKSAADALTRFATKIWQEGGDEKELESALWEAWSSIIEVAQQTSDDQQDGLVKAVQAVQEQGELKRDDGTVCTVWDATVWTDLPVFGAQFREAWDRNLSPSQWRNVNAFAARLTASSYKPGPRDFALYGIWTMRSALETPEAADKKYDAITQQSLEAASMWMLYCAETLLRQSTSHGGRAFDGRKARAGDGYRDKDWKGLNTERWILWKETLQAIISSDQQSAIAKLLERAVKSMETAEQQSG